MNIQCDRCKEIFDDSGSVSMYETDERNHMLLSRINFNGLQLISEDVRDKYLCPKCTKELRDWIGLNE